MPVRVEVDEVQATVLYGYGSDYPHGLYLRLALDQDDRMGAELARWSRNSLVTFGAGRKRDVPAHANCAFTPRGLRRLGVPRDMLDAFPDAYQEGARRRAAALGDTWTTRAGQEYEDCDLLVSIVGQSAEACADREGQMCLGRFREVGRRTAGPYQNGDEGREAFGFADGRSQPAIEGVDLDPVGDGVLANDESTGGPLRRRADLTAENFGLKAISRSWRLIRPGEFLLGYENEDGELPVGPPAPLGPNGTFMVYREIDQYRSTFDDYVRETAAKIDMSEEELSAKIVGRWKDGTPVGRVREERGIAKDRRRANDFRYEGDPHGFRCPLGAHVRRANPRDALPGGGERTLRHRIIRRGTPYREESGEMGLAFVCFSASIENGFEFIQREWINRGDALGLGGAPDFILQQPDAAGRLTGKLVIQGYRPIVLGPPPKPFVSVRGCEYLFVPSRRALEWLSQLGPTT